MMRLLSQIFTLIIGGLILSACHADGGQSAPASAELRFVDLDAELASAGGKPAVILIGEFGPTGKDAQYRDLLDQLYLEQYTRNYKAVKIDLSYSPNRAQAARYHLTETPIMICLSPKGIIVSRDTGELVGGKLAVTRLMNLPPLAQELDASFKLLSTGPDGSAPDMECGDFLMWSQNKREAIPYFAKVASSRGAGINQQIDARVKMARAHLWIGEPEKARHEAKELIATLGADYVTAVAGGNFVLGLQDATAKRFALARHEFETAVQAAALTDYGKQAVIELAKLPRDTH
jgi:hypothetical protein